ncbi:MAG: DUF2617 family protein [Planctomycetaceae bacterium]
MSVRFARPDISELMFHVFERSLHPELFQVYKEQDIWCSNYWAQIQICDAGHLVSFHLGDRTVTEVVATRTQPLPKMKQSFGNRLVGSREASLRLHGGISYQVGYHLEQLDPEVFANLHEELLADCDRVDLSHKFSSDNRFAPESLSVIRTDAEHNGLLIHAIHTFPSSHAVVRSQSLFELNTKFLA